MPERRPRISVVNDNAEFLDLMAAILDEDAGYDVSLFKGEVVEISELAASDPDLIIVDLLLGGASGGRSSRSRVPTSASPMCRSSSVRLTSPPCEIGSPTSNGSATCAFSPSRSRSTRSPSSSRG